MREFWLAREPVTNKYTVSETKISWSEMRLGDERIHVREVEKSEEKLLDEAIEMLVAVTMQKRVPLAKFNDLLTRYNASREVTK